MYTKNGKSIPMTKKQISIIIGTVLGDASITRSRNKINTACVRFTHSIVQKEFCKYKANLLLSLANRKPIEKTYFIKNPVGNRKHISNRIEFTTCFTREIFQYYSMFYKNGIKIIPDNIEDLFDDLAIAIWYMDDGSLYSSWQLDKRKNKYYFRNQLTLHTNGFSYSDCTKLQKVLENKYQIHFYIKKIGKKKQPILYIRSRKSIEKFIEIIESNIIPSMRYKIETNYPKPMKRRYSKNKISKILSKLKIKRRSDLLKIQKRRKTI